MNIMLLILLIIILSLLLIAVTFIRRHTGYLNREYYSRRWQEVQRLAGTKNDSELRLAVIEADKLLSRALRELKIAGENTGERLKNAGNLLGNQNAVWSAHKLRNRLVHEDVKLKKSQAMRALSVLSRALKGLGAL